MRRAYRIVELVLLLLSVGMLTLAVTLEQYAATVIYMIVASICIGSAVAIVFLQAMAIPVRVLLIFLCMITLFTSTWIRMIHLQRDLEIQLPFPNRLISTVQGIARFDSSISQNGNRVLRICLESGTTDQGDIGNASGELFAILPRETNLVAAGTPVTLKGELVSVDDGMLLYARSLRMNDSKGYRNLRIALLQRLKNRLSALSFPANTVCTALLLGRYTENTNVREMAVLSGSAHVLALSGMHLQVITGCLSLLLKLFLRKRTTAVRLFVVGTAAVYVLIIGPKPSLIRAFIMLCLPLLLSRSSSRMLLLATLVTHVWISPHTIISSSALLSYGVLTGIFVVVPEIASRLALVFPRRLALVLALSIGASLVSAPFSLSLFGSWRIVGMVTAPLVAPLAMLLLLCTLLFVVVPVEPLSWIIMQLSRSFMQVTQRASSWSLAHEYLDSLGVWIAVCIILLTVLGVLQYASRIDRIRSRHAYDLGFSLRFTPRNNTASH